MLTIKVLGSGCENCHKVEAAARQAVSDLGIAAQIEHLTERADWAPYHILSTPGLVINEKLVCAGRIPSVTEVTGWLNRAMPPA
ncbi:MAG: thioredoxin family protein [Anaerolineae bacterium]